MLMSAVARDYAFVVKAKEGAKPLPAISKERLEAAKADAKKHQLKK